MKIVDAGCLLLLAQTKLDKRFNEMDVRLFENIVDKVCSTQDLQTAITDLQHLLAAQTDIEGVFVGHHAPEEKRIHNLVYAGGACSKDINSTQPVQEALHDYLLSTKRKELNLVSRLNDFPALATSLPSNIPTDHSFYECRVRLDGKHIGMLGFHAPGPCLSDGTLDLLMKIRGPIALNVANRLSQLKVWPRRRLSCHSSAVDRDGHIVCSSLTMRSVYGLLNAAAPTCNTVLLTGETGVGKDVLARQIHDLSPRRDARFMHVNCGSISESLIESEFFGHEQGAFTGATVNHRGFFEQAHGGTIFLDEIGELPLAMQTRLLQVLQSKTIRRVGGVRDIPLDFRVVAATNCDLESMCREGRFRRDLFFRLNCIRVEVPPLRARREDIPVLAECLLKSMAHSYGRVDTPTISPADMCRMVEYEWPGNVRELENCLQRSLVLSSGTTFRVDFVPSFACDPVPMYAQTHAANPPAMGGVSTHAPGAFSNGSSSLNEHVRHHLEEALRLSGGRIHGKGGAAELLDINPSTLRSRLKKMGIPFGRNA